jgi:hypothetical protein
VGSLPSMLRKFVILGQGECSGGRCSGGRWQQANGPCQGQGSRLSISDTQPGSHAQVCVVRRLLVPPLGKSETPPQGVEAAGDVVAVDGVES